MSNDLLSSLYALTQATHNANSRGLASGGLAPVMQSLQSPNISNADTGIGGSLLDFFGSPLAHVLNSSAEQMNAKAYNDKGLQQALGQAYQPQVVSPDKWASIQANPQVSNLFDIAGAAAQYLPMLTGMPVGGLAGAGLGGGIMGAGNALQNYNISKPLSENLPDVGANIALGTGLGVAGGYAGDKASNLFGRLFGETNPLLANASFPEGQTVHDFARGNGSYMDPGQAQELANQINSYPAPTTPKSGPFAGINRLGEDLRTNAIVNDYVQRLGQVLPDVGGQSSPALLEKQVMGQEALREALGQPRNTGAIQDAKTVAIAATKALTGQAADAGILNTSVHDLSEQIAQEALRRDPNIGLSEARRIAKEYVTSTAGLDSASAAKLNAPQLNIFDQYGQPLGGDATVPLNATHIENINQAVGPKAFSLIKNPNVNADNYDTVLKATKDVTRDLVGSIPGVDTTKGVTSDVLSQQDASINRANAAANESSIPNPASKRSIVQKGIAPVQNLLNSTQENLGSLLAGKAGVGIEPGMLSSLAPLLGTQLLQNQSTPQTTQAPAGADTTPTNLGPLAGMQASNQQPQTTASGIAMDKFGVPTSLNPQDIVDPNLADNLKQAQMYALRMSVRGISPTQIKLRLAAAGLPTNPTAPTQQLNTDLRQIKQTYTLLQQLQDDVGQANNGGVLGMQQVGPASGLGGLFNPGYHNNLADNLKSVAAQVGQITGVPSIGSKINISQNPDDIAKSLSDLKQQLIDAYNLKVQAHFNPDINSLITSP